MLGTVRLLVVGMVICMLFSMCTKEDPTRKYNIEKETREWTAFKPGSYWVYELEGAGAKVLDSTYVSSYTETVVACKDESGNKINSQKIDISYSNIDGHYTSNIQNNLPRGNAVKLASFDVKGVTLATTNLMLVLPLEYIDANDNLQFTIISDKESLTIGKEEITEVLHVKCTTKGFQGKLASITYENQYWVARNRWIIKMLVKNPITGDSQTWNLVRYKIVQ